MSRQSIGPYEQVRLAYVARRRYVDGVTNLQLADELGVSRFKVARMLDDAVEHGIIRFDIHSPGAIDVELSLRLQDRYRLHRSVVVHVPVDEPQQIQRSLGLVAAQFATETVEADAVLGLTAGRTLSVMARSITSLPTCDIVQLAGIAGPIGDTGLDIVRRMAVVSGGSAFSINAPLIVASPGTASELRSQPELARTFAQFDRVTVAFVAIGSWRPADSELHDGDQVPASVRAKLAAQGVVAEIGGVPLDAAGATLPELEPYALAVDADGLRRIPDVVAVAGGSRKASAILAALRSGLVDSLITDAVAAGYLLSQAESVAAG